MSNPLLEMEMIDKENFKYSLGRLDWAPTADALCLVFIILTLADVSSLISEGEMNLRPGFGGMCDCEWWLTACALELGWTGF